MAAHSYEFGSFSVDASRRLLLRDGAPVPVAPKALETLLALIENRERVVTKDELMKLVWGDTIVEEAGLARNISVLRKTLGEQPNHHQYIVTAPGRGYQFVAEVFERSENGDAPIPLVTSDISLQPSRASLPRRWQILAGLTAAAIGLLYLLTHSYATDGLEIKSIAVFPLRNLTGDPAQEYFADGMTEALSNSLGEIRALRVIPHTAAMSFKGSKKPLEVARELKVDAFVEGSLQTVNGRVRVMIRLVHGRTGRALLTHDVEGNLSDALKVQSEAAWAIAEKIRIQVTPEEEARLTSAPTVNPAAHDEYLLGRYLLWKGAEANRTAAVSHFKRATELDPAYADAHASLAMAWLMRATIGPLVRLEEAYSQARAEAGEALRLNSRLADAHVALGVLHWSADKNWREGEKAIRHALELDSNNLGAHFYYASILMRMGRNSEATTQIQIAAQLNPVSGQVQQLFGRILYLTGKFDEAIEHLNLAIELEPQIALVLLNLGDVYEHMGQYEKAVEYFTKARDVGLRHRLDLTRIARVYARMGRRSEARRILEDLRLRNVYGLNIAGAYIALGDKDEAFNVLFSLLEKGPQGSGEPGLLIRDPQLDPILLDPRWQELVRRINYPTAPPD